ncbi:acyl-CoA dehydrogenase family protein [Amycolatopsis suaedae]|uniref:Acyl-CoA dehydrogenase n=1 Tax=Amycolatopsis suaedae TaxID=2510978 RepID=A0A4Q7JDX7_9PSEU|nr:acyl-CoA dehydrogenase family protein [Amycolatopsis suaedae]RZQ66111.1 acyl-CoA dehydrogenase [Amycolatopsis suaedae]
MTDLRYSDVEEDLRASVRDLLTDRCAPDTLLGRIEGDEPYDRKLWRTLAVDLGVAGLPVAEACGGQGASVRETALVLEELGRALAPVPFLGSAVLATLALPEGDLLRRLATGEAIGTLAVPLSTAPGGFPATVRAEGDRLTGRVSTVADATVADVLLVPVEGPALYAVEASAVTVTEVTPLDLTRRLADVTFDGAAATPVLSGEAAVSAVDGALTAGAALLASEQLGIAQWCLEETVRYVKQRYQFGRPVGSFQALKHRLADVWLDVVAARATARYAADAVATGSDDVAVAAALAQARCSDVAVHAAEECVQLHGGIGMTWEHPAHLYLKRAKSDQIALGTPGAHRRRLATLVDLPA